MKSLARGWVGLAGVLLGAASSAQAATAPAGITVEGVCNRRVVPDRGAMTVTADVLEKDLQAAVSKATGIYERVRAAVKKLPLEDLELETSEYSVREERVWEKDRQVPKGFRARMGLRVMSSSIPKLGEVILIASRESVRDVGALSTFLSPDKLKAEQMACLTEAAAHARAKAEKLAAALGVKAGPVTALSEFRDDRGGAPPPFLMKTARAEMMDGGGAPPAVEAGQQDISTSVTATFSLK